VDGADVTLRAREHPTGEIAAEQQLRRDHMAEPNAMMCPQCGIAMNYHAEKIDYMAALIDSNAIDPDLDGVVEEVHTCSGCGNVGTRRASPEGE
jgi:transposase